MQTTTILYIILALLLSLSIAFYQYFYKTKNKQKINILLFSLKTFSIFLLLLLLINPTIKTIKTENIKPVLSVLIDNSMSVSYFNQQENTRKIIEIIEENKLLNDKFEINQFTFGTDLNVLDSLSFDENQTNISKAIEDINKLYKDQISPVLLITDGNQTIGNDYEFVNSKQEIYPLVIGDTTQFTDLKITQLNANRYSYLKNQFPVEVFLVYDGNEEVKTQFSIYGNGKTLFTKTVRFSPTEKSKIITANLTSTKEGINYYTATVGKIANEKNSKNNSKSFSVEVIDEQTKILLLTDYLHPDIGALKKAIESNKQRVVDVQLVDRFENQLKYYQLVILYQPNNKFNKIFNFLRQEKANYFMISGIETDWSYINNLSVGFTKKAINQSEDYTANYNNNFLTFFQENIGFENLPPLKDKFGEVNFTKEHQTLLFQNINGIESNQPLLATFEENNHKAAILFGEGIWKWRSASFLNQNSFQDFDEFINNFVQYLASNKKRSRLEVTFESLYPANSTVSIAAFYVDKNYQFDSRASLWLHLTNTSTKERKKLPFSLENNSYKVDIEGLLSGDYTFLISVDNEDVKKYGKFKVTDYQVEEQFTNANKNKLQKLANKTNSKLFYPSEIDNFIKEMVESKNYYTTQKSIEREQNLIDWKWILGIVIFLLSLEWFVRKYYGKI